MTHTSSKPTISEGTNLLKGLARDASPNATRTEIEQAYDGALQALRSAGTHRGQRRRDERAREINRVLLMLSEWQHAQGYYRTGHTRKEAASRLGLTPRQLRTREKLVRRALDHFGIARDVGPPFRGRPPHSRNHG